jgi:hypothetical protein
LCGAQISALILKGQQDCPNFAGMRAAVSQNPNDQQNSSAPLARRAASYSDVAPSEALVESAFWGRTLWTDTSLVRMSLLPDTKRDVSKRATARKRSLKRA